MVRSVCLARVVALVALLSGAVGCGSPDTSAPDVVVQWTLTPEAAVVGPARLEIGLRRSDGSFVDADRVRIEAHMTHPGMAPVLAEADRQSPGTYTARLAFTMPGDWVVLVTVDLHDGRHHEERFDLRVSGPGA